MESWTRRNARYSERRTRRLDKECVQNKPKDILIVGAGAVGVVYGAALHAIGENVTFWVREKYLEETRQGIDLHTISVMGSPKKVEVSKQAVAKTEDLVNSPDEIWLCVSKTAVKSQSITNLVNAFPDAHIVSFQPGLTDLARLKKRFPEHKIDGGVIGFVAYQPHAKETRKGISVWYPPAAPSQFYTENAADFAARLTRGGCPSKVNKNAPEVVSQMTIVLNALVLHLELVDWKFKRFKEVLKPFNAFIEENLKIVNTHNKTKKMKGLFVLKSSFTFQSLLQTVSLAAPFDFEAYLEYHFLKVRDQSIAMLRENCKLADQMNLPHSETDSLLKKLGE